MADCCARAAQATKGRGRAAQFFLVVAGAFVSCVPPEPTTPPEPMHVAASDVPDAGSSLCDAQDQQDDGGCGLDDDASWLPCDRLRSTGRLRHSRPDYPHEIEQLERLLASTPVEAPDHAAILQRLVSDNLEFACLAFHECVRAVFDHRGLPGAATIVREGQRKVRLYCERLRAEHGREDGLCRGAF